MRSYKNKHRITIRTIAMALVCLFFVNSTAFADVENNTLSPKSFFSDVQNSAEIQAAILCELIERRADQWQEKTIEQIYLDDMLLWKKSTEPYFKGFDPVLFLDKSEIKILIPQSDICIRYYNSERGNTLTPLTNWKKTKTHVISKKINRQITHAVKSLPPEKTKDESDVKKSASIRFKSMEDMIVHIRKEVQGKNPKREVGGYYERVTENGESFFELHVTHKGQSWFIIPESTRSKNFHTHTSPLIEQAKMFVFRGTRKLQYSILSQQDIYTFTIDKPKREKAEEGLMVSARRAVIMRRVWKDIKDAPEHIQYRSVHKPYHPEIDLIYYTKEMARARKQWLKKDNPQPICDLAGISLEEFIFDDSGNIIEHRVTMPSYNTDTSEYSAEGEYTPEQDKSPINIYVEENKDLITTLLADSSEDLLLRVPVEIIELIGIANTKDFLGSFQSSPNGYLELYYMSGNDKVSDTVYQKYGLKREALPEGFKKTRCNTITVFPALRGEEVSSMTILTRLGDMDIRPTDTILSPAGLQNDLAGLVRSTIFGLKIMHIARQQKELGEIDDDFLSETVDCYKELCKTQNIKGFNLTKQDIISIASGSANQLITALNKIIKLLPIQPVDTEELRYIYEYAKKVLLAA